jgi:hypothetical protein
VATEWGSAPAALTHRAAIGYALGQWDALTLFLTDVHLPLDNRQ